MARKKWWDAVVPWCPMESGLDSHAPAISLAANNPRGCMAAMGSWLMRERELLNLSRDEIQHRE